MQSNQSGSLRKVHQPGRWSCGVHRLLLLSVNESDELNKEANKGNVPVPYGIYALADPGRNSKYDQIKVVMYRTPSPVPSKFDITNLMHLIMWNRSSD